MGYMYNVYGDAHKFDRNVLHLFNLQDVLPCHLNAKLSNGMEKRKKAKILTIQI